MEPEGSLPHSQEPACHLSLFWAKSVQSIPSPSHFLKIHFNIFFPSTPWSSKWLLHSGFPTYTLYALSCIPPTCYISEWSRLFINRACLIRIHVVLKIMCHCAVVQPGIWPVRMVGSLWDCWAEMVVVRSPTSQLGCVVLWGYGRLGATGGRCVILSTLNLGKWN